MRNIVWQMPGRRNIGYCRRRIKMHAYVRGTSEAFTVIKGLRARAGRVVARLGDIITSRCGCEQRAGASLENALRFSLELTAAVDSAAGWVPGGWRRIKWVELVPIRPGRIRAANSFVAGENVKRNLRLRRTTGATIIRRMARRKVPFPPPCPLSHLHSHLRPLAPVLVVVVVVVVLVSIWAKFKKFLGATR